MYEDADGDLHVVGLLQNGTGATIHFAEVTANFHNSGGTTVASDDGVALVLSIAAGADAPFEVILTDPPPGITGYTVIAGEYQSIPFLSALNISETVTAFDTTHVAGTITNNSGSEYIDVIVWAAVFDSSGNMLRVDVAEASPSEIGPGDSATFDVFFGDPAPSAASARAWADGIGGF
jgi:hypothetical protein